MKPKILVISSYDDSWNAVRPEAEIFIGLHKAGFEVDIMTQGYAPYVERFRNEGLRVIEFHPRKKFDPEAVRFIRGALKKGRYDILHLFNNKAIVNGNLAAIGLPVRVLTYRGYTGNIHWYDPISYLTHLNPRVDRIVCLADSVRDHIRRNLLFRNKELALTINKGHHPSWYEGIQPADLSEFDIPPGTFVVGCVANAARRMKGMPYLIEATRFLPRDAPIHFLLIGSGMDHPRVAESLRGSPFRDRIHMSGFRMNPLELISACDASVLPSIFGEATPKAVLESMYLGIPTIMTSIAGNKGLAIHNDSGMIVPPRNARAIAGAIEFLWQNPDKRREIGRKGQEYIAAQISLERSVREYGELYLEEKAKIKNRE
jgi:L-malate glycosyltransferase